MRYVQNYTIELPELIHDNGLLQQQGPAVYSSGESISIFNFRGVFKLHGIP
jgi:hypothetical protein